MHYQAIAEAARVGEGELFAQGKISPEAQLFLLQRAIPHGDNAVLHTGYQLGTVYHSQAVIANSEVVPVPELAEYRESTVPGVRAPHAWLQNAACERLSTLDLWGRRFVLIGHNLHSHWERAARSVVDALGVEIAPFCVGEDAAYRPLDAKFARLYETHKGGVVLVRPDGFIAAKLLAADEDSAHTQLLGVMQSILGVTKRLKVSQAVAIA
ncbi:MAG: hypothetical protein V4451_20910 [Pseudomonadota bacterium]